MTIPVTTIERKKPIIESREFINHTECHCVSRRNPVNLHRKASTHNGPPPALTSSSTAIEKPCRCVRHYTVFHERVDFSEEEDGTANSRCRCDCEPENGDCDRLKRGIDGFSIENRRCIEEKRCGRPTCQYGHYNTTVGRCPRVEDKLANARLRFD